MTDDFKKLAPFFRRLRPPASPPAPTSNLVEIRPGVFIRSTKPAPAEPRIVREVRQIADMADFLKGVFRRGL